MHDSLRHSGILGMKWGRRKSGGSASQPSSDHTNARSLMKKKLHEMSNSDIEALANRMRLEKTLKSINPQTKLAKGQKHVEHGLEALGALTLAAGTVVSAYEMGKKILKMLPQKAISDPKVMARLAKIANG